LNARILCSGQTVGDGGAQSQGVSDVLRQPGCQRRVQRQPEGEKEFASLTSGSRAHGVRQAITPWGNPGGSRFLGLAVG